MEIISLALLTYFIGCFSPSYCLGKIFMKIDIRSHGSGNAGATNALRVMGKKLGALTLILDLLKGVLAVLIGRYFLGDVGEVVAAISVVIGHDFPITLRFKGGKGVATSLGIVLILYPKIGLLCILIGIATIYMGKIVSIGSILAAIMAPILIYFLNKDTGIKFYTVVFLAIILVYRHRENIKRVINGNENKLGKK